MPPIPRRFKCALPHPAFCVCSRSLLIDVVARILAIGERPALGNHPPVNVVAVGQAHRDNAPIAVPVLRPTLNDVPSDFVRKSKRRTSAARPCFTLDGASLTVFRCINPEQPNARPVHFDCVAVNDRCLTFDRLRRGSRAGLVTSRQMLVRRRQLLMARRV